MNPRGDLPLLPCLPGGTARDRRAPPPGRTPPARIYLAAGAFAVLPQLGGAYVAPARSGIEAPSSATGPRATRLEPCPNLEGIRSSRLLVIARHELHDDGRVSRDLTSRTCELGPGIANRLAVGGLPHSDRSVREGTGVRRLVGTSAAPGQGRFLPRVLGSIGLAALGVVRPVVVRRSGVRGWERVGLVFGGLLLVVQLLADRAVPWALRRRRGEHLRPHRALPAEPAPTGGADPPLVAESILPAPRAADELLDRIAQCALPATGADGAYVAQLDPEGMVRVIAVAGDRTPPLGVFPPFHALSAGDDARRAAVSTLQLPLPFPFGGARESGSALVVPLAHAGGTLATLVLLYDATPVFLGRDTRSRATRFGGLAEVMLRVRCRLEEANTRLREVERASESRAGLLRGFAHDLQSTLWAADGSLQLLEMGGGEGPLGDGHRVSLVRARRALDAGFKLVRDLQDLARGRTGRIEVRMESCDLRNAVCEVVEEHHVGADAKHLSLDTDLPPGLPRVVTDLARVQEVLRNLLSNAIKYTPSGGTITVRAQIRPIRAGGVPWVAVDIIDSGPGIRADDQEIIFQEFTRLPSASGIPGDGIGLAISRHLTQALGGKLTLRSVVGCGSTFTIWLPISVG